MIVDAVIYMEKLPAGDNTNYTFLVILALPTTYQLQVKQIDIMDILVLRGYHREINKIALIDR